MEKLVNIWYNNEFDIESPVIKGNKYIIERLLDFNKVTIELIDPETSTK